VQARKNFIFDAANSGNMEVAEDVNAKTKNNQTPPDFAVRFKRIETGELPREPGGKTG